MRRDTRPSPWPLPGIVATPVAHKSTGKPSQAAIPTVQQIAPRIQPSKGAASASQGIAAARALTDATRSIVTVVTSTADLAFVGYAARRIEFEFQLEFQVWLDLQFDSQFKIPIRIQFGEGFVTELVFRVSHEPWR